MNTLKVKSIVARDDKELESILNKINSKYYIKEIIFLGNNYAVQRIYQLILEKREF